MKKVARMRLSPNNVSEEHNFAAETQNTISEPIVRTTGRIKKPRAVFDPSDNYLPRSQRALSTAGAAAHHNASSVSSERRSSYTKTNLSPVGSTDSKDACVNCKKKESKRPVFASKNPLITCQACQRKIHKLCLKVEYDNFEDVQRNFNCDQCSVCRICNDMFNNADEEMITCSKCTKSFHLICFPSGVNKTDNMRKWKCNKCQIYNQITNGTTMPVKKIREIIGGGEPLGQTAAVKETENSNTEKSLGDDNGLKELKSNSAAQIRKRSATDVSIMEESAINNTQKKRSKGSNQSPDTISVEVTSLNTTIKSGSTLSFTPNENFDEIPDVKEWSVDQVYEFFYKSFPKEAHVFKDEEIDGRSLLLLKRSDVVKKLPIKLGPSLRIYGLILKIQAQFNDPTLGWNCGL